MRYYKGQLGFVNVVGFTIAFILYFIFALPLLNPLITQAVADANANPNAYTSMNVALFYLVPFVFLLGIMISLLHYAIPHQESVR